MTVKMESKSRKSPIRTGEIELMEFFAQRRAWDDQNHEIACSDARAFMRGVRNALQTVMPLWLALAWWLAR
jgi:hypothetical protein